MPTDPKAAFLAYHEAHPEVFDLFERFALKAARSGRDRFSARIIAERIRWEMMVDAPDGSGFKLNDHHTPYYARLFMERHPEMAGFFEIRERKASKPEPCWDAEAGVLFGEAS